MEIRRHFNNTIKAGVRIAQLVLALIVLWQGARLAFRPDPLDDLRRADQLFAVGRYYDARAAYQALTGRAPRFAPAFARLGMVATIRGEYPLAEQALAYALGLGSHGLETDLIRLYQGRVAAQMGARDEAARFWGTIGTRSPLFPLRYVLEGESLLVAGDYASAEATYRAALPGLPADWRPLVTARLASLRAADDPAGALAELERAAVDSPSGDGPSIIAHLLAPLRPTPDPDARQLADALRADPLRRPQLLGQLYLQAGMYALAEAQFNAVDSNNADALAAAAYAAYVRWRAGDRAGGIQRLEALVAAHPDHARAHALLALTYLSNNNAPEAHTQLETLRALAPRAPDTHLAWGQWYAAQHDYIAAAEEFSRALDEAQPSARGPYALALAQFHVDIDWRACEAGRPPAEEAIRLLPDNERAWTTLAAVQLACGEPAAARTTAEQALRRSPTSAEASYYLGRALAALGDRFGARQALVKAADLAPASSWRERAETQLATLGL